MHNHTYATDLTDRHWHCISPLIPPAKAGGRPRSLDMRAVVNAILYVVVTGCQWRLLPRDYPKWPSVYPYYARWRDDGTWRRMHDTLRAEVRLHRDDPVDGTSLGPCLTFSNSLLGPPATTYTRISPTTSVQNMAEVITLVFPDSTSRRR